MINRLLIYWMPLLWVLVIVFLCLMPRDTEPEISWLSMIPYFDKIIHAGLYGVLMFLWILSRRVRGFDLRRVFVVITVLLSFFLGVSIEFLQPLVDRASDPLDVCANCVGLAGGLGMGYFFLYV